MISGKSGKTVCRVKILILLDHEASPAVGQCQADVLNLETVLPPGHLRARPCLCLEIDTCLYPTLLGLGLIHGPAHLDLPVQRTSPEELRFKPPHVKIDDIPTLLRLHVFLDLCGMTAAAHS